MRLLLLFFISFNLFASDILTSYRVKGTIDIEKQLDMELSKEEYWKEYLADKDTTFGYIEAYNNVLACDKSKSALDFYSVDQNKSFKFKKTYSAFTGKFKGDKIKEGDLRTPIGIYQIVQKLSKETNLDPFYGPLAFVTSYPNVYDTYRGKNGSGIWIHGLPAADRDEFTRGCIAINNSSIECLGNNIDISKTLLIINDSAIKTDVSKEILTSILAQLYAWRYAWIYDDIDSYLSFYSSDFVRFDGMDIEKFKSYKTRIFKKAEKKSIIFNDINVLPYPNSANIYQITFQEFYRSESFQFSGEKTLVVEFDKNRKIRILTEK
ncbi:MAG: L,D-transpeptidase family protein [Sulfurimonas sp.]